MPHSYEALEERLRKRGTESEASILTRLQGLADCAELRHDLPEGHHVIINDDLDTAASELRTLLMGPMSEASPG